MPTGVSRGKGLRDGSLLQAGGVGQPADRSIRGPHGKADKGDHDGSSGGVAILGHGNVFLRLLFSFFFHHLQSSLTACLPGKNSDPW